MRSNVGAVAAALTLISDFVGFTSVRPPNDAVKELKALLRELADSASFSSSVLTGMTGMVGMVMLEVELATHVFLMNE